MTPWLGPHPGEWGGPVGMLAPPKCFCTGPRPSSGRPCLLGVPGAEAQARARDRGPVQKGQEPLGRAALGRVLRTETQRGLRRLRRHQAVFPGCSPGAAVAGSGTGPLERERTPPSSPREARTAERDVPLPHAGRPRASATAGGSSLLPFRAPLQGRGAVVAESGSEPGRGALAKEGPPRGRCCSRRRLARWSGARRHPHASLCCCFRLH